MKQNKRYIAIGLLFLTTILVSQSGAQTHTWADYFDQQMPAYLEEYDIVGASVTVVEDGAIVVSEGYGYADLAQRTPMNPDETIMHIGSSGKTFTAVAVMQLVESGLLDLDTDVNSYLDFELPATYPEPITIRHLLTHTSGFAAKDFGIIETNPDDLQPIRDYLIDNMPTRVRPPEAAIGYSNYGMTLLGYIVERVSGMPLSTYLEKHILTPLNMTHSSAEQMPSADTLDAMAVPYRNREPQAVEYIAAFGAAPIRATAADMARFMRANLDDNPHILQPETTLAMQTQQYSAAPEVNGIGFGFYEMSRNGERIVGHLGTTNYFHTLMLMFPDQDWGIFVSFNSAEGAQVLRAGRFLDDLMTHFFPHELAPITPPDDFADRADEYTGTYFWNNLHGIDNMEKVLFLGDAVTIDANHDTLSVTLRGEPQTFIEIEPDTFRHTDSDDVLVFHRNADDEISGASLSSRAVMTLVRRPWYEAPILTLLIMGFIGLIFVGSFASGLVTLWKNRHSPFKAEMLSEWCCIAIPVIDVTFLVGMFLLIINIGQGVPETRLQTLLFMPFIAAVLTLMLIGFTVRNWRKLQGSRFARLRYAMLSVASISFLLVLDIWNLLTLPIKI